MSPTFDAFLGSWPFDPWLLISLVVTGAVYLRGWLLLRRRDPGRWHGGPLAAFLGGLTTVYLALASPIEPFAALLLSVHMLQHLLLMMVAPPLLWMGAPLFPMMRGLARVLRIYWVAPLLSLPALRRCFARLTHPLTALVIFVLVNWTWHVPPIYDLALRSTPWHYLQHACFLGAALLFWYPIVRPYPSRPRWSLWLLLPYLLVADLSNTLLSALLTFSERVLYPYYAEVPRLTGLSALEDQSAAGLLMWVPGSLAFLLPLAGIGVGLLSGRERDKETRRQGDKEIRKVGARVALPLVAPAPAAVSLSPCLPVSLSGFDLLCVPLLGRFLRWRHARFAFQVPLLLLAALVIYDGLRGPQVGAMNLAGVLPWVHWRGVVILGLLAVGNVFCMGCPFLLPRTIARRWLPAGWHWPRWLRSKWLAVLLLIAFLWAYEALALWDRPFWTACLALGYFAAAFLVDGLFRGASFCKYLCPIGQFNFVQSLASPVEVRAREPAVCASCLTHDCIRGRDGIPGCELRLFVPRKSGNMDCTACLDCIHACPHENIGLIVGVPGAELWRDRPRSGIGRFARRPDIAALVLVVVFGAFVNAAGMVGPVTEFLNAASPLLRTTAFYMIGLVVLPVLAVGGAAVISRRWGHNAEGLVQVATRYTYALVPLGFGMWLAHYCYHFLTSYDTIVPVGQRFVADLGLARLSEASWTAACCRPPAAWLLPLELLFLDFGLLLSLYTAYRLAPTPRAMLPWAVLIVLLFAAGVWIVFQPMQMRGTF